MNNIMKTIIIVMLMVGMSSNIAYAYNDMYSDIPLDINYTEHGFIWYKQSSYIEPNTIGWWLGNTDSYRGNVTSMPNPTNSGCGPISFAIIATNVKQELITPAETIQYYCDTGLYTGNGSSHSCGVKSAQHYELSYDEPDNQVHRDRSLDKDIEVQWMAEHLKQGHWIQILVKGTPNIQNSIWPYAGGHYVAIHGYNNGNTYVYDSSRQNYLEVEFSLEEVWENIRNPFSDNCAHKHHMTAIW